MLREEYKYLNWTILFVIMGIFVFPLIVTRYDINIKNCTGNIHCVSCGITRDIYQIITLKQKHSLINNHSFCILLILLSNLIFRLFTILITNPNVYLDRIIKIDIIFSTFSLLLLFINLNLSF